MRQVEVELAKRPEISVDIQKQKSIQLETATQVVVSRVAPDYDGGYEFTPSDEQQVVPTAGKTLKENIVINPIPSNYGLISYNGFKLTVS